MDPLALVQEPFGYFGPRYRHAGGNCQPFQRCERLRAYGPVGVAVLVYAVGHFVSWLTNLIEDIGHGGSVDCLFRVTIVQDRTSVPSPARQEKGIELGIQQGLLTKAFDQVLID